MKSFTRILIVGLSMILLSGAAFAQTTGSVAGTVSDPNGAVVPGATVTVKGEGGQEFSATSTDDGTFRIPSVQNGLYVVTVKASNFKTTTVSNVKVDIGTPTTVDVRLEVGNVDEVVQVTSGGEILQTQTATVGSTVTGRQIRDTPIASRDALDLVLLMPGTNTVGAPRRTSIMGLPKGSLSITIDGVDVQDNLLRSSDGYFTYVRPRVDAIEEVTVSSAVPGAESSGDGAVQIRFVTRRGTNNWSGGAFYQRRHESLNANYFYNNANGIARSILRLNQYGAHLGGPIPFLNFGEGVDAFDSGKNKRHFFVNYEEFRLPDSLNRQRTILTTAAQQGIFTYIGTTPLVGGVRVVSPQCTAVTPTTQQCARNVLTIAETANAAATTPVPGRLSTVDPTIAALLARIRQSVGGEGTITQPVGATVLTRELYNFSPRGNGVRKFLATRFDFNLTKSHSLEFVMNRQKFVPSKDFLNSQDERFPGFPFYTQGSDRNSYTAAVRSTFGQTIANEARVAASRGFSAFAEGISTADFGFTNGLVLGIDAAGITTPYSRNSYSARTSPTTDFTDSMTWIRGLHTINFGGQYKRIELLDIATPRIVPSIGFGITTEETALLNTFNTTVLPGASAGQLTEARNLYATLIGHVSSFASTAYLDESGRYQLNGTQTRLDRQDTYGLFAQDAWKIRPNLTVNFGLRWQPQGSYVVLSENYANLSSFADVFGPSGVGNLFRPGTLTGSPTTAVITDVGYRAYNDDKKNFAPSVGVVWSPNFGTNSFLSKLVGANGKSVFAARHRFVEHKVVRPYLIRSGRDRHYRGLRS